MESWVFYYAGLRYGRFRRDGTAWTVRWKSPFDPAAGAELPVAECAALAPYTGADLDAFLRALPALEAALRDGGGTVTAAGAVYTKRDRDLYVQRGAVNPRDLFLRDGKIAAVLFPGSDGTGVLLREGQPPVPPLAAWDGYAGERAAFPVSPPAFAWVPMRDGTRLAADIYLPLGCPQPVPVLLVRTPYSRKRNLHRLLPYVQRGYGLVVQDVRGREDSEGDFFPMLWERDDGDDTLSWLSRQPFCSGKIGTLGGSYLGYVQWAMLASGNPHLSAMISQVTAGSPFADFPRRGGTLSSGAMAWAFVMSHRHVDHRLALRDDWDRVLEIRPLEDLPRKALGYDVPFLRAWIDRQDPDGFWRRCDWAAQVDAVSVPVMLVSGWFDDNGAGSAQALERMGSMPADKRRVILGPWTHSFNDRYDIHGIPVGVNGLRYDLDLLYLKWFDRHLMGLEAGLSALPPVSYYTLGEDRWKGADCWPPDGVRDLTLYLGGTDPVSSRGNGTLSRAVPPESRGCYRYDPRDPAEHLIDMAENELAVPEDYTEAEGRQDVLCYTSPPLPRPLTVSGRVRVLLSAASDGPDTDFFVRLTEVTPEGRSIQYAFGMLTARFREGFENPRWMEPNEVCEIPISTCHLSKRFPAGSRLRLTVTSGAKNLAFPHSNTKEGYNSPRCRTATQTVFHGGAHPSRLILPVEPPERADAAAQRKETSPDGT